MIEKLIEIIENKNLTNEQWQKLATDLIKLAPENKYNRIYYLLNKDKLTENLTLEDIIKIIENVEDDANRGMYCDESYYDYSSDMEIVEGDSLWIDGIDSAFRGIKGLFQQKKYDQVIIAYEYIFNFTEGNNEELYSLLPEYYYIEEKLESDLKEHYFNYLEAIYYSKNADKIERFCTAFKEHRYYYTQYNLIHEFCKKHEDFKNDMIEPIVQKLATERYMYYNEVIFELLIEKNEVQSVMQFLKENITTNINVFKLLCGYMLEKNRNEELLENLYEIEKVEMPSEQKELVYQKIIKVAEIINNEETKIKYLYKINELNPSLEYALEICKNLSEKDKVEQIEKLDKNLIVNEENQDEKILITLMLGKIEKVYEIYQKMKSYKKGEVEDLIIYYMLKFGNNNEKKKKLLSSELKNEINKVSCSLDTEEIVKIMYITKNDKITDEFKEKIESILKRKVTSKTKKILGTQERGRYQQVAKYLVILVEHFYQEGKVEEAKKLLYKYENEYKRYSAYRRCIQEELGKSSYEIDRT